MKTNITVTIAPTAIGSMGSDTPCTAPVEFAADTDVVGRSVVAGVMVVVGTSDVVGCAVVTDVCCMGML